MRNSQSLLLLFTILVLGTFTIACVGEEKSIADTEEDPDTGDVDNDVPGDVPGDVDPDDDTVVDIPPDFPESEFGLDDRPSNATCLAPDRPPAPAGVDIERAFQNLSFSLPLYMVQAPGDSDRWFVVEKRGRVMVFPNVADASDAEVFIDITSQVDSGPNDAGLLVLAFHPDWPTDNSVFLSYNAQVDGQLISRISRFTASGDLTILQPGSEEVILEVDQPYGNHNGGQIDFGPDGYLYFSLGDGGSGNDPLNAGQDTSTLLGSMLRIDVDNGDPYGIPADNPFADGNGGQPEIYAWGLRNPWRWSFDMETGELWAGDVGQNAWEEIDIIELGGNYGWKVKEGFHCRPGGEDPCPGPYIDPIVEHPHSDGEESITGGYVYRGDAIPGLNGTYIYGDFVSGRIFKVSYDENGDPFPELVMESGQSISSFGQGLDGEMYVLSYGSGQIFSLVAADAPGPNNFPTSLSETGCMDPENPWSPGPGLIPYDVNAKLWSDGAGKRRFIAIPDGETITVGADGDWELPVGSVVVKGFQMNGTPIETRLFVRHSDGGWAGYTYEWDEDGQDATLLESSKTKTLPSGETWTYPSRSDCLRCHTAAAGFTLGLETAQLNGDLNYESTERRANQLATLDHIGMFDAAIGEPGSLPALAEPFGDDAVDERARSYLHSNCSNCHREGGRTNANIDLEWTVPLADMEACDVVPNEFDLGIPDARIVAPGNSDASTLVERMRRLDVHRMPPLASDIVHDQGVELMEQWVNGLAGCQ